MLKTLSDLLRGTVADQAQAIHDANAVVLLRQQIRDAAGALAVARRELAIAMAHQAGETRAVEALTERAAALEDSAAKALAGGREDLATQAAIRIAALEDEVADRRAALDGFAADVARLRRLVEDGERRLRDLDRGLQAARATEAVRRAGANGRRGIAHASGALQDAEVTPGAAARTPSRGSRHRHGARRPRRRPARHRGTPRRGRLRDDPHRSRRDPRAHPRQGRLTPPPPRNPPKGPRP